MPVKIYVCVCEKQGSRFNLLCNNLPKVILLPLTGVSGCHLLIQVSLEEYSWDYLIFWVLKLPYVPAVLANIQ